ncbi:MAG TPA: recombination mediator RecR [Patescibacteria group bacterium]|nr:recombination mediator RecR [Patescibacteria group bacterium]
MKLARPLQNLIDAFQRLPGIGPKSAQRLAFYLLHVPQQELESFAEALSNLKKNTVECSICHNISETDPCMYCSDNRRDASIIAVVEQPIDILAVEKSGKFHGLYHVLHGRIDPLNNIRPEDIRIDQLVKRTNGIAKVPVEEIILALNPDMEGEATCMYIVKKLTANSKQSGEARSRSAGQTANRIRISRLAYGLPSGASIEYADELTLSRAIEGRREY